MWSAITVIASIIFAIYAADRKQSNVVILSSLFACLIAAQAGIILYSENNKPLLREAVTKGFGWVVFGFLISALISTMGELRTAGLITYILIGVGWMSVTIGLLFSSVFRDVRLRVGDGWEELHEEIGG
ncbi:hypothetical protein Pmar_PMAR022292 [Perkinsus marinus ATCC 50983]|uniref:Uncharacterized protein n=1 Tax=Perkinsus marinus (strain ATCC 50983 / TXsc) TaxID=423536 RepID=C5KDP7_PERM5|nr:hypothetical protein Pmar_PMAR022292 [Perkinsus marinus ATCC 50983]EER17350.1 hypothetical protein Pmar_PMAR022292 [Perkinsus marinus ATCC 50983]|eukprot:XP_002785554.1 hypothetical protein Pmar_PMAR022292 [Perkinsus marinus ATCC 50983]